jgi:hypothetical protein
MQKCGLTYERSARITTGLPFVPVSGMFVYPGTPGYTNTVDLSRLHYMLWCGAMWESVVPRGPQGQKRPADVIGAAVMVAKIATGEMEEPADQRSAGKIRSGKAGAKARAEKLTSEQRSVVAKRAALARWNG